MDIEQQTIRKAKARLLPLLIGFTVICFIDRVNLSFAAPTMMKDLGFTATVYGLGAGLFFIPYILFEVPSNIILAKVGARVWFTRIMVTWGLISGAQAFIQGETSFYTLRLLLAVAEAGCYPGVVYFISLWFPEKYRAGIIGSFFMALPLSVVLGGPISGPILNLNGLLGLAGWQWLFLVEAVPAVLGGLITITLLPASPNEAKWLTTEERDWLVSTLESEKKAIDLGHRNMWRAAANPLVIGLGLICFCIVVANWGLSFFLPQILKGFGMTNVQTGLVTAIPFAFGAFGVWYWGKHSDRTQERKLHVVAAFVVTGGFIGASTLFVGNPLMQVILISLAGFGMFAYGGPFWAMATTFVSGAGPAAAAAGLGVVNSIANISGFATPYAMGYIKDATGSFTPSLAAIAVVQVIGIGLVLLVSHARERQLAGVAANIQPASIQPEVSAR